MTLFDVALHFRFEQASNNPDDFDLRGLSGATLLEREPDSACVFVDNHDTQPGQALESWVQPWFKPLAYAYVMLRDAQYPCVFFGDLYGVPHDRIRPMPVLNAMVWIRAHLLGDRVEEQPGDSAHSLCWCVAGEHPVCVVLNTSDTSIEREVTSEALASRTLVDICHAGAPAEMGKEGHGTLTCPAGTCSIYIDAADEQEMRDAIA